MPNERVRAPKRLASLDQTKEMFESTGDFRWVALAIGERPDKPPEWAMKECIREFNRDRKAPVIGNQPEELGKRLDAMIRYFIQAEDEFEERVAKGGVVGGPDDEYTPPPTAKAIAYALAQSGIHPDEGEYIAKERQLRRAWQAELENGPFTDEQYLKLEGMPVQTERMLRVLLKFGDAEYVGGRPLSEMPRVMYYRSIEDELSDEDKNNFLSSVTDT